MTAESLFDRVFVPVASTEDARSTARALLPHLRERGGYVVVGHVIEKAGGAPDKASVEQREQDTADLFAIMDDELDAEGVEHECHVLYGTDVAERIIEAAGEHDASVIAFTPRDGSRWLRLLTGDVSLSLMTEADRPVVVLPDVEAGDGHG